MTPSLLADALAQEDPPYLLDVRTPEERQVFHLGGALIPLDQLAQAWSQLPHDQTIVIYCRSGHRSYTALRFLKAKGVTRVCHLEGGILAWQHWQQQQKSE